MTLYGPIPPMPAELVNDHPAVAAMTAADLGALWALAHAFWRSGAHPLPDDDASLAPLAKCYSRRWYDMRSKVLPVWREIEPRLATVYAQRVESVSKQAMGAHKANEARRAKKAATATLTVAKMLDAATVAGVQLVPRKRNAPFRSVSDAPTAIMTDS